MNKQTEALKLALEALSASDDFLFNYHDCEPNNEREVDAYSEVRGNNMKAWEAIREALAEQPAQHQEPVAWMHTNAIGHVYFRKNPQDKTLNPVPLYTSPPASKPWVGLTDDEIALICAECSLRTPCDIYYARAIEAKLREKNAQPSAPAIPEGWKLCATCARGIDGAGPQDPVANIGCLGMPVNTPVTAPQPAKRKPLTDEQIMEMYNEPRSDAEMIAFARAIEAAHGITGEQA